MGQAPPGKECNKEGVGTVFVKAGEFGKRHPVIREWTTKPLKHAKSGDVLICVVGATAGKINLGIECAIGRSVAAIRPKIDKLDVNYLHYFMRQEALKMRRKSQGLAQGVITKKMLADLPIPLPPLSEQKRIAAILDQTDALRRQRQRALDQLNQLDQSIFYEMFGDSITWVNKKRISEVAELINGDRSSKYPSGNDILDSGVLFLSSKNIINSELVLNKCNYISQKKFDSLSRGKLKRNDLVVTLRGSIGQCAEFDCEYETGFINAQMMIIRPNTKLLSSVYFREVFTHPLTQAGLTKNQSGSAVPQLTGKQISEFEIPIPKMSKQSEFNKLISTIKKDKNRLLEAQKQTETLFASLQQRAFRGEL